MNIQYHKQVLERMKTYKGDSSIAEESVKLLDEMVLSKFKKSHPQEFYDWLRADMELYNGSHYDKEFAIWEVSNMYHIEDNKSIHGEKYNISVAENVYTKHKTLLNSVEANIYDVYVAINTEYHDRCVFYKNLLNKINIEDEIIDSAINFYFGDVDAPIGKIWKYHNAMRNTNV